MATASSSAPSSSQTGSRQKDTKQPGTFFLGRYRVVDEIGVGGMASVHLARMDGPGGFQKWVAIKRIHPHLVEDDQFVDMFLDEARIAAGINHANVAQVFDLGKDDNTYWIAMEYLHGEPLREIMRRTEEKNDIVPAELAARICADAAEGLHAAHELRGKNGQLLGLVHRDVTPHNLFVTYDGYTKVVDFGIAKVADRLSQTRAGTLKGKLAYMSPEQVRGGEVDRTTDIFALGVVLWELTTNQRLFRMDTDLDTLEKVQACIVPPPSSLIRGYPPELESIVLRALAKRKQDRFATAREFSRALQGFLIRRGSVIGPEEVAQYVRQVFGDRIQKREAHLAWAAEVTSTVNVDQLRAAQGGGAAHEELSLVSYAERDLGMTGENKAARVPMPPPSLPQHAPPSGAGVIRGGAAGPPQARPVAPPPPPRAEPQMAAASLIDDDEDVPTTVATRDHLEEAGRAFAQRSGASPQPAVAPTSGPRPQPAPPPGRPAYPGAVPTQPAQEDRTTALPGPFPAGGDDLGATVALPNGLPTGPAPQSTMRSGGPPPTPPPPQGYAYPPASQRMGAPGQPQQSYGQPGGYPAPQGYGAQPQGVQPQAIPNASAPGQAPMPPGYPQTSGMHPQMPQSQVETALSLPRPDPAALWAAQQSVAAPKRNTGVLILIGILTAVCVVGIGAFAYLKTHAASGGTTTPETSPSATASAAAAPSVTASAVAPPAESAPAPEATAAPTATATATAAPTAAPAAATGAPAKPAATSTSQGGAASGKKEDPGFLTIVCTPFCDDVIDQGRSLGPSPVVRVAVAPGQHRITLKRAGQPNKVISVIVVSGQVTAQRVSMK